MKKILTTLIAGLAIHLFALPAMAQEDVPPTPGWVSEKGYWVVESHKDLSIVYFYNNDHQLMYKEQLTGDLDVSRRRIKLRLTQTLEQVVTAWEKDHMMQGDRQLLAGMVKRSFSRRNKPIYRQMMNGSTSEAPQP